MAIATVNPATGEVLRTFEPVGSDELDARLTLAANAYVDHRVSPFARRREALLAVADILDADIESIAHLVTTEMGKTLGAARAEVAKCATGCRFYAENAQRLLADEPADAHAVGARSAYTAWLPLGPVLAVMPWNFPLWQVIRFAAPAIMAGNVALLKHASNVPQTALLLEDIFRRAGFAPGVFQTLLVESGAIAALIADDRVAAVTVTGSEAAGRAVASAAGQALKPTVLELGGSDPFLVLPSADIGAAAAIAVTSRCQNNGQSCIAAKRLIVHADVAEEFTTLVVDGMRALQVGDPLDDASDVGPLATEQVRADAEELLADAVAQGARVLCGGCRPAEPGFYFPPTLVAGVTPAMRMYREEVFGPVASVFVVPDLDAGIALANDVPYGLGANVWTTDAAEQARCIDEIESGQLFVNGMTTSYPELPFGGVKQSGYGRELGAAGLRAFCNAKTVWIGPAPTR